MIHDVDESIKALLERELPDRSGIDVAFDSPTTDWASRRNGPTIDVYLYDIREDLRRRVAGKTETRDESGRVLARGAPPRYFKLSYLLTAWTQRPEDEHRLLSALLACFLRHDFIPVDLLAGSLAGQPEPVRLSLGRPPAEDRSFSDVWSAMGGELKPSLDLVISTAVPVERSEVVAPPVLEKPRFSFVRPGGGRESPTTATVISAGCHPSATARPLGDPVDDGVSGEDAERDPEVGDEVTRAGADITGGRVFHMRSFPRP